MANSKKGPTQSKIRQAKNKFNSFFRWLVKPASSLPDSLKHQSILLAWTLLLIIPLALVSILVIPPDIPQFTDYIVMILAMVFIFMVAFFLNRIGHYLIAAVLAILGTVAAPWGSLLLDPVILQGDIIPLNFIAIPILLCSILLPPLITAVVAGIQLTVVAYLLTTIPATDNINWRSFLTFLGIISTTSILASYIRRRDLKQIEHQRRLLLQSEAKLREQSIRDHLTGLYNRRYLDETLEREVRRAERGELPVGIIMLDIDHFKNYNDKYSHTVGDIVLQEIATLLKAKIRSADIVCRYGGEEFVVVMPEASLNATLQRAKTLRKEVKSLDLHHNNQNFGAITISAGVAIFPDHGSTGQAVMQSADSALHTAKQTGRDRVVVAS